MEKLFVKFSLDFYNLIFSLLTMRLKKIHHHFKFRFALSERAKTSVYQGICYKQILVVTYGEEVLSCRMRLFSVDLDCFDTFQLDFYTNNIRNYFLNFVLTVCLQVTVAYFFRLSLTLLIDYQATLRGQHRELCAIGFLAMSA